MDYSPNWNLNRGSPCCGRLTPLPLDQISIGKKNDIFVINIKNKNINKKWKQKSNRSLVILFH